MLDVEQSYDPVTRVLVSWLCDNRPFKGFERFAQDFAPLVHAVEHSPVYKNGLHINHGPCLSTLVPFKALSYVGWDFPFRIRRPFQLRDVLFQWEGNDGEKFHLLASPALLQSRYEHFHPRRIPSNAERLESWLRAHKDCANVTDDEGWVVGEFTRGPAGSDRFYFRIVC